MNYSVGQTIVYPFTTRNNGVLHDFAMLQVSFLKSETIEDALTYGGTAARDSWITRTAVGSYAWQYTLDSSGEWRVKARWSDDGFVTCGKGCELILNVKTEQHTWVDSVVPYAGLARIYHGVGAAGLSGASTIEAALQYTDANIINDFTYTVSPDHQKVYLAYPSSLPDPQWTHYGWTFSEVSPRTEQLHDANGVIVSYDVREITGLQTGSSLPFVAEFSHA